MLFSIFRYFSHAGLSTPENDIVQWIYLTDYIHCYFFCINTFTTIEDHTFFFPFLNWFQWEFLKFISEQKHSSCNDIENMLVKSKECKAAPCKKISSWNLFLLIDTGVVSQSLLIDASAIYSVPFMSGTFLS